MTRINNHSQPATKKDLKELRVNFAKEITKLDTKMDKAEKILESEVKNFRDEILTLLDQQTKILDRILTEQQAITVNYKRLDHKVEYVQDYIEDADKKLEIGFERT